MLRVLFLLAACARVGATPISLEDVASAPASFSLVVSGHHDHPDFNGRYTYDGEENGKPKWAKVEIGSTPKLYWTGSSWDCFYGGYSPESSADTPVPPLDGYDIDKGGTEIRVSYEHHEGDCYPNHHKCDSSIGGDCCTARYTSHEDRRCHNDWIPIYTGVGCGWPHHDGEANMFTCYSPTCSNLPEDNCGPNSCYDDGDIAKVVIIVSVVILAVAIIGTLGGVYGCYKGKCCCFSRQPKPPQPMAQSAVAQPVIPMVQPATTAYQAQPVAYQAQPGMTKVV